MGDSGNSLITFCFNKPIHNSYIDLIGDGMTTKETALKLFLSESALETHRKNIKHKIGVSNPFRIKLFLPKYKDSG